MFRTAVPKTAVYKNGDFAFRKNKVWFTEELTVSSPVFYEKSKLEYPAL